jgi:hypothetical protein
MRPLKNTEFNPNFVDEKGHFGFSDRFESSREQLYVNTRERASRGRRGVRRGQESRRPQWRLTRCLSPTALRAS